MLFVACLDGHIVVLKQVYTAFDRHLDALGVYKLDTIGDAFVVVAGLEGFGSQEASELAATKTRHSLSLASSRGKATLSESPAPLIIVLEFKQGNTPLPLRVGGKVPSTKKERTLKSLCDTSMIMRGLP